MDQSRFQLMALALEADRSRFNSGSEPLDRYFQLQVGQDIRRRVASCFVAMSADGRMAGYYTLASASLLLSDLPLTLKKKLPRYPTVPAVRMGRLAVDQDFRGMGLGAALLADALIRASRSEIASYALMVDAKDDAAAAFYQHHGFIALADLPLTLFLPLASVRSSA